MSAVPVAQPNEDDWIGAITAWTQARLPLHEAIVIVERGEAAPPTTPFEDPPAGYWLTREHFERDTPRPKPRYTLHRYDVIRDRLPAMVGKTQLDPWNLPLFYHAENGTQAHHRAKSPGGIDLCVLDLMQSKRIAHFVHHRTTTEEKDGLRPRVLVAEVETILRHGWYGNWGDRDRIYLSYPHWGEMEDGLWFHVTRPKTETIILERRFQPHMEDLWDA